MLTRPVTLVANMMFMSSSAISGARAMPFTRPLFCHGVSRGRSECLALDEVEDSRVVHQHINLLEIAWKLAYESVDFARLADV